MASYLKTVKDGIRDDTGARAQFLMGECFLEQNQHIKARTEFAKVDQLYAFPQWQSKGLFEMPAPLRRRNKSMKPGRCSTSSLKNILKRLLPGRLRKSSTG